MFQLCNFSSNKINGKYEKIDQTHNNSPVQCNKQNSIYAQSLNSNYYAIGPIIGQSKQYVKGKKRGESIFETKKWIYMRDKKEKPENDASISEEDLNNYDTISAFILKTPQGNLAGKYLLVDKSKELFNDNIRTYKNKETNKVLYYDKKFILAEEVNGSYYGKFDTLPFQSDKYSTRIIDKDMIDEFNTFPDSIAVECPQSNITGGQIKSDKSSSHQPVQQSKDKNLQIQYYIPRDKWFIGSEIGGGSSQMQFSNFPESEGDQNLRVIEFTEEEDEEEDDDKYTDPDFTPTPASIGEQILSEKTDLKVQWIRASKICDEGVILFDGIDPNDVSQGAIGDCWLMAAISALAEFPDQLKSTMFPGIDELTENCEQNISLQDQTVKKRIDMKLDDQIPCEPKNWWDKEAKPLFSKSNNNEIQVNLIEKAFAKYAGSYSNLVGGSLLKAVIAMTGCENNIMWSIKDQIATCKYYDIDKSRENQVPKSTFFRGGICYLGRPRFMNADECETTCNLDTLFEQLQAQDRNNQIMGASMGGGNDSQNRDGLVFGHAYSLISIHRYGSVKLIKLRNPWGKFEWTGKWGDADEDTWNQQPRIKKELQANKDDGMFQMGWEDFCSYFGEIEVLCENIGVSKGQKVDKSSKGGKLKRESNKFMKIPKNEFKKQMQEQIKMNIMSKISVGSDKKDSSMFGNPMGFIMNMLQSSSQTSSELNKLAILKPDEDEKIQPSPVKDDINNSSKTKKNNSSGNKYQDRNIFKTSHQNHETASYNDFQRTTINKSSIKSINRSDYNTYEDYLDARLNQINNISGKIENINNNFTNTNKSLNSFKSNFYSTTEVERYHQKSPEISNKIPNDINQSSNENDQIKKLESKIKTINNNQESFKKDITMKYVKLTNFVDTKMEFKVEGRRSEISVNRFKLSNEYDKLKYEFNQLFLKHNTQEHF